MGVWVPPRVSRELLAEREQFNAHINLMAAAHHVQGQLERFNRELKHIDRLLELVYLPPGADTTGTPCRPGYYHVIRRNENAPITVIVVEGEHGEPVEPTARLFDRLREGDLWDANSRRRFERRQQLASEAADRERIREREARHAELVERVNAATRTQVSMNRDTAWSQNASPAARRDQGQRRKRAA